MINIPQARGFRRQVESELRSNILPFWMKHAPDEIHGGFVGAITNDLVVRRDAPKGVVLNARVLWTFSHAYRTYAEEPLMWMARRAYDYLAEHFWDRECGGYFWTVDAQGAPADTSKKTYAQAFVLYALAEYYRASKEELALRRAEDLFRLIESKARDPVHGGYFETYSRDWTAAPDQRLSEVDMDEKKSMNTNLHVLEAYAGLIAAGGDAQAGRRLRELIGIFLGRILDPRTRHFRMFFDEAWNPRSDRISFGHDIEGSWLLCEAAEDLGDPVLMDRARQTAASMARSVLEEARDPDGGILYEAAPSGIIDDSKQWWPQAEAVVGFLNAWQITGEWVFLRASVDCWDFIREMLVDREHGEWTWGVSRDGRPDGSRMKADLWKCPYHNSRMCFQVMSRLDRVAGPQAP